MRVQYPAYLLLCYQLLALLRYEVLVVAVPLAAVGRSPLPTARRCSAAHCLSLLGLGLLARCTSGPVVREQPGRHGHSAGSHRSPVGATGAGGGRPSDILPFPWPPQNRPTVMLLRSLFPPSPLNAGS